MFQRSSVFYEIMLICVLRENYIQNKVDLSVANLSKPTWLFIFFQISFVNCHSLASSEVKSHTKYCPTYKRLLANTEK